MKYIYVLFLLVSFSNQAESNVSYRFKYTALKIDTELNHQSNVDLYVGDFLLSEGSAQSQKRTLNESLSIIELGTSYNWGYLILSADYAFNISGEDSKPTLSETSINDPVFNETDLTISSSSLINDIEYQSGQASIGIGNGYFNVFGGYRVDSKVTSLEETSYIVGITPSQPNTANIVLDNVIKGPFAGVSWLYDVTENSYLAMKLALTQYESGHLMISNDNVNFNEPLTGKALSFSTKWTGKYFFIGFQSKYYKSDTNELLSVERKEVGLDIGFYFL